MIQTPTDTNPSKYLLLDSSYRTNGTSNSFSYTFTDKITINNYVKLVYSSIPNSAYLFNSTNNTFTVSYNGSAEQTINLGVGTLRTDQVATSITNQFIAFFPTSNFTCSLNQATIQYNSTASNPFYFKMPNALVASILGFNLGINNSVSNALNSPNIINTIYPDYVHLYIDKINNNSILSSKNILSSYFIPMNADRSIVNVQSELSSFQNIIYTTVPITVTTIQVSLYNPDGSLFQNNNVDWNALLQYS